MSQSKYTLRPYQNEFLSMISASFRAGHRRVLGMAPTGFGKTICSYEMIRSSLAHGKNVLFTCHRINLAQQSYEKFDNLNPSLLQGNSKGFIPDSDFHVATIQTLFNRADEIMRQPDLIIIDEVHYGYKSALIQNIIKRWPMARILGLSATPLDERGYLLEDFDHIVDKYDTAEMIKIGGLVPFECYTHVCPDLTEVKLNSNGEYLTESLAQAVNKEPLVRQVVEGYKKYGQNEKFICFAVNKQHCEDLKNEFISQGIPVEYVTADTPVKHRNQIYGDHKTGKLKGLISIEILTTGYDDPTIKVGVFACPSKSITKVIQMNGRIIRLLGNNIEESIKNGKSKAIYIDCAGLIEEHGMPGDKRKFTFKAKISKVIDRELGIDEAENVEERNYIKLSSERMLFLKKVGSILDLYEDKVYSTENALQADVNTFLKRTGYLHWRQNSGKANMDGRWVNFTSKAGLPDCTLFYENSPIYIGIELKMPYGKLTDDQKITLPEMIEAKALVFFAESVKDVFDVITHVENNIKRLPEGIFVYNSIYQLPERQQYFRKKFKL